MTIESSNEIYDFFKNFITHILKCVVLIILSLIQILKICIGLIKKKFLGKKVNVIQML